MTPACEHCALGEDGINTETNIETEIAPGLRIFLCYHCRREWWELLERSNEYAQHKAATLRMDFLMAKQTAKGDVELAAVLKALNKTRETTLAVLDMGQEWLQHGPRFD